MKLCQKSTVMEESLSPDISKPARIACVVQLCLAFSVLFWILGAPFTETLYENKKTAQELEWLTADHADLFNTLPTKHRNELLALQKKVFTSMNAPFFQKLTESIEGLFLGIPTSKPVWLLLAFILPILAMKQVEGAKECFWLFPLLAALYAWQIAPMPSPISVYPTEAYLEKKYLNGASISGSLEQQKTLLEKAWQAYVIAEWSQLPTEASAQEQLANGMYYFTAQKTGIEMKQPSPKPGIWTLTAYFVWNLVAAICVRKPIA